MISSLKLLITHFSPLIPHHSHSSVIFSTIHTYICVKMPRTSERAEILNLVYYDAITKILNLWDDDEIKKTIDETDYRVYQILAVTTSLPRQLQWANDVLPRMDDSHFRTMMRVSHHQFHQVLNLIKNDLIFHDKNQLQFPVSVQLAIVFYRLGHYGNSCSLRNIATLFGIGDGSTVTRITRRVFQAILKLEDDFIFMPDAEERRELEFPELPGCILFMDGTDIKLEDAPGRDKESFFDKNKNYSVKVNILCDKNKKIRAYKGIYPGSVHDSQLFDDTKIGQHPENYLSPGQFIAADKAYRLTNWVIVPFRENSKDLASKRDMKNFNYYFSKFRVWIEHLNGALKETFQSLYEIRLRISDDRTYTLANEWISVCLILYNILMPLENYTPDPNLENNGQNEEEEEAEEGFQNDVNGKQRRIELANWVLDRPIDEI